MVVLEMVVWDGGGDGIGDGDGDDDVGMKVLIVEGDNGKSDGKI